MTAAAGFLVSFGVIFLPAMLHPSVSSSSLCSVLSNVILGAGGGSGVLVLSLCFTSHFTSTSLSESWVHHLMWVYVSESLVWWSVSSAATNAFMRRQGRQSLYPLKVLAHWGWMAS